MFDSAHVLRSQHKAGRKARILLAYWRLTFKLVTVAPLLRLRRERFCGFRVESFDYETLHFLFREIFVRSEYWFDSSSDQPLIFDCGANIGMATLFFKWLYPRSVIHCFEPDRPTFEMLRRNVQANHLTDVHPHNVALSDVVGAVEFFVSASRNGSLLMSLDPQRTTAADYKSTIVDGTKLSAFVNGTPVDLVKLDIEGAEGVVLRDLVESGVIRKVKQFVVEYPPQRGRLRLSDRRSVGITAGARGISGHHGASVPVRFVGRASLRRADVRVAHIHVLLLGWRILQRRRKLEL